jgi:hypothetical protein
MRTLLIREAPANAKWTCDAHASAWPRPYVDVMECSVCGRAMWAVAKEKEPTR